jgi:hypothetical protein
MADKSRLTAQDFSGSGGPEHSKMLAQQFVDQHERRLLRIMMERANSNIGARKWSKDCRQVGVSRSDNGRARNGVLRYTPPELGWPLVRADDFPKEVSKESALCGGVIFASDSANCSNYVAIDVAHFDHCPYPGQPFLAAIRFGIYRDLGARHRHHAPKNLIHIMSCLIRLSSSQSR